MYGVSAMLARPARSCRINAADTACESEAAVSSERMLSTPPKRRDSTAVTAAPASSSQPKKLRLSRKSWPL